MKPSIFEVEQFGEIGKGVLSVANVPKEIPFEIKRVVWLYGVEDDNERGNHANIETVQVFFCLKGALKVALVDNKGQKTVYVLDQPNQGLIVPPDYFRTLVFDKEAILVVLNSHEFSENDYVRDINDFLI